MISRLKHYIETNKNSSLDYGQIPASTSARFLASFLDALIFIIISGIGFYVINGEFSIEWTRTYSWQIIYTLYLAITPVVWSGYIIGKRIFRIKVKRIDEGRVTIKNMVLREFVGNYFLSTITFGISAIISIFMIMLRDDKRGIHDIIGGTYVGSENK